MLFWILFDSWGVTFSKASAVLPLYAAGRAWKYDAAYMNAWGSTA